MYRALYSAPIGQRNGEKVAVSSPKAPGVKSGLARAKPWWQHLLQYLPGPWPIAAGLGFGLRVRFMIRVRARDEGGGV